MADSPQLSGFEKLVATKYQKMLSNGIDEEEVKQKMDAAEVTQKVQDFVLSQNEDGDEEGTEDGDDDDVVVEEVVEEVVEMVEDEDEEVEGEDGAESVEEGEDDEDGAQSQESAEENEDPHSEEEEGVASEEGEEEGSTAEGEEGSAVEGEEEEGSVVEGEEEEGSAVEGGEEEGSAVEGEEEGSAVEGDEEGSAVEGEEGSAVDGEEEGSAVEEEEGSTEEGEEEGFAEEGEEEGSAVEGEEEEGSAVEETEEQEADSKETERAAPAVAPPAEQSRPALKEHERFIANKYKRMLKSGIPVDAVINKMNVDQVSSHIMSDVLAEADKGNYQRSEQPEPSQQEAADIQEESVQGESVEGGSVEDESVQGGSVQDESVQGGSVEEESVQGGSVQDSVQGDSVQEESAQGDSVQEESVATSVDGETGEQTEETAESTGDRSEDGEGDDDEEEGEDGHAEGDEEASNADEADDVTEYQHDIGYDVEGVFVADEVDDDDDDNTPPMGNSSHKLDHEAPGSVEFGSEDVDGSDIGEDSGELGYEKGQAQEEEIHVEATAEEEHADEDDFKVEETPEFHDDDDEEGYRTGRDLDFAKDGDVENQENSQNEAVAAYDEDDPLNGPREKTITINDTPTAVYENDDVKDVTVQEQARIRNIENEDAKERRRFLLCLLVSITLFIAILLVTILVVMVVWLLQDDDDGDSSSRNAPLTPTSSPVPVTQPTPSPDGPSSVVPTLIRTPQPVVPTAPSPPVASPSNPSSPNNPTNPQNPTPAPVPSLIPGGPFEWRSDSGGPLTFGNQTNVGYGRSLAWAGEILVTGVPRYAVNPGAGAAQSYDRSGSTVGFVVEDLLTDSNAQSESFGFALDMTVLPDNNTIALLVGAPDTRGISAIEKETVSFGSAYYYESDGQGGWTEIGNVLRTSEILVEAAGRFGQSVALASEMRRVVVAAPSSSVNETYLNSGAVFTYDFNGTDWERIDDPFFGPPESYLGTGLALRRNGMELVVGSAGAGDNGGLMEYYEWIGDIWELRADVYGLDNEFFGASVAIIEDSEDGTLMFAVGGPGRNVDQGVVRVYGRTGNTSPTELGQLGNDIIGNPQERIGTAIAGKNGRLAIGTALGTFQVYDYDGSDWIPLQSTPTSSGSNSSVLSIAMADDAQSVAIGLRNEVRVFDLVTVP